LTTLSTTNSFCSRIYLNDPAEGRDFEKHFYCAFKKIKDQRLIRKIWKWDDDQQTLKLKIPDEKVAMYTWKNSRGQNVCYVGGIYERSHSQFEYYGFNAPEEAGKYCEILTLFSTIHFEGNLFNLEKVFLKEYCYEQARMHGCKSLLATCAPHLLKLYLKWNWKLIETRNFEGGIRHFIQFDL
jgi:hypothetical protein